MPTSRQRTPLRSSLAILGTILSLSSCGQVSGPAEAAISRESFIATYADLRLATLATSDGDLSTTVRDSILNANGVSADQLLAFATLHGPDAEYMREVWSEVGARMDGEPLDSTATPDAAGAQRD